MNALSGTLYSLFALNMVGESLFAVKKYKLEDVLTEKQLQHIVKKYVYQDEWDLVDRDVAPAMEGIAGFLGDHLKVELSVKVEELVHKIHLFVKRIPYDNKPKADFIKKNNFYKREMFMFHMFEQMKPVEGEPCYTRALLYNESILVLPNLSVQGYSPRPPLQPYDLPHVLVAITSLAKFHAVFANHETKLNANGTFNFLEQYGHIVSETVFKTSPWLRTAAKLAANLLDIFDTKYKNVSPDMEKKIYESFLEGCDSLREYKETLNVVNHKDLWANNIMFRYENDIPVNAILIDFQCIRYAPPSFDVMSFLYLNTTRCFRERYESYIIHYYYSAFTKSLDESTKQRLQGLGYDRDCFLGWCERSRMFGMVIAICLFPYGLMDPVVAQQTYDDPATFDVYLEEDRTAPVVAHARECAPYKDRQLEAAEEYVERFVLGTPPSRP